MISIVPFFDLTAAEELYVPRSIPHPAVRIQFHVIISSRYRIRSRAFPSFLPIHGPVQPHSEDASSGPGSCPLRNGSPGKHSRAASCIPRRYATPKIAGQRNQTADIDIRVQGLRAQVHGVLFPDAGPRPAWESGLIIEPSGRSRAGSINSILFVSRDYADVPAGFESVHLGQSWFTTRSPVSPADSPLALDMASISSKKQDAGARFPGFGKKRPDSLLALAHPLGKHLGPFDRYEIGTRPRWR
jgi:hypothetical protein